MSEIVILPSIILILVAIRMMYSDCAQYRRNKVKEDVLADINKNHPRYTIDELHRKILKIGQTLQEIEERTGLSYHQLMRTDPLYKELNQEMETAAFQMELILLGGHHGE
jgi:hypothetical protein